MHRQSQGDESNRPPLFVVGVALWLPLRLPLWRKSRPLEADQTAEQGRTRLVVRDGRALKLLTERRDLSTQGVRPHTRAREYQSSEAEPRQDRHAVRLRRAIQRCQNGEAERLQRASRGV